MELTRNNDQTIIQKLFNNAVIIGELTLCLKIINFLQFLTNNFIADIIAYYYFYFKLAKLTFMNQEN